MGAMADDAHSESDDEGSAPDVRFSYANERTFLAWIRTALGLVTAGLAITQLLPPFDFPGGRRLVGLPLIALGVVIALLSFRNWQRNEHAMKIGAHLPDSVLPKLSAIVVSVVAVIGFLLAVFAGTR
jgi:putative membrane protein